MPEIEVIPSTCILHGLEEIARYLRVHPRTVRRWIHDYALPAMQTPAGTWITSPTLIDAWIIACGTQLREQRESECHG